MRELDSARVITLVDNDVWQSGLKSSWGLSLYVETRVGNKRHVLLMDTSGSFETLSKNASNLNIRLANIEAIFISHWHRDHCGSLSHVLPLLTRFTPVYVPSDYSSGIHEIESAGGTARVCSEPVEFMDGVMSTGVVGGGVSEHAIVMKLSNKGLVILAGCSHPGIIRIIRRAQRVSSSSRVRAVVGGFHISDVHEGTSVGEFLHKTGVELVSPCHCTSSDARTGIVRVMGKRYVRNGSGRTFSFR